jgi:hypothetical protein
VVSRAVREIEDIIETRPKNNPVASHQNDRNR